MKFVAGVIAFSIVAAASSVTATKPKPKRPATKTTAASTAKTATSKTTGKSGAVAAGSKINANRRGRGRGKSRVARGPSYQAHPDPERYQQIQQALADKGYYKGAVTGEWNDDSTDALRRFQADQKLESDGKINALTLRDLGLGPKHDGSSAPLSGLTTGPATVPPPVEPPPMPTEPPDSAPPPE